MKRRSFLLAVSLTCSLALTARAQQDAELPTGLEVLAKFIQATGGEENYKKLTSMQAKGKMSLPTQGIRGTIEVMVAEGGKLRADVDIAGLGSEKVGGDGETYWSISNFTGVRILDGPEKDQHAMEADLQAELNSERYFKSQTVTGTEQVGDEDCYRVERLWANGDKQVDFFSVDSGLHLKSVVPAATPLGKIEIATMISDYRKVGDLLVAFRQEQMLPGNIKQVIAMETIKLNEMVPEETFALPQEVEELASKAE